MSTVDKENVTEANSGQLHRKLKVRQLSMIALGGSIGTGLFLASGQSIHMAGPGGALFAYMLMGLMVYFLMTSLGEMAAFMPTAGSFYTYAAQFVDPAFGFALGVNYWFNWAITIAAEISAASLIMAYWFPHAPPFLWSSLFLGLFTLLNALSVQGFGEAEYWFSFIKVTAVIAFIIIGTAIILGISGKAPGFTNWHIGDAPFHGGWLAIMSVFMFAGFSFQGTELIGVAAGESKDPKKDLPKAMKQVFWRILLFYVLALVVVAFLIPYTSTQLVSDNVNMSPFTLVFKQTGIVFAAALMNAIVLVAILSAGNSGTYASTRMLWYLAKQGHVPAVFTKLSPRGVPVYALIATLSVGGLAFLSSFFGSGIVYVCLINASALSGFIAWLGIAVSHYRFRKAYVAQGYDLKDLPYVAKGYPYAPLLALCLCLVVIAGQGYTSFHADHIDWYGMLVSYISVPLFLALWFGYKWKHKTKIVDLAKCSIHEQNL